MYPLGPATYAHDVQIRLLKYTPLLGDVQPFEKHPPEAVARSVTGISHTTGCQATDFDHDADVDQSDFAVF